jgi:hypothetical protein
VRKEEDDRRSIRKLEYIVEKQKRELDRLKGRLRTQAHRKRKRDAAAAGARKEEEQLIPRLHGNRKRIDEIQTPWYKKIRASQGDALVTRTMGRLCKKLRQMA